MTAELADDTGVCGAQETVNGCLVVGRHSVASVVGSKPVYALQSARHPIIRVWTALTGSALETIRSSRAGLLICLTQRGEDVVKSTRTDAESRQLDGVHDKLSALARVLDEVKLTPSTSTEDWYTSLAGIKDVLGNFNNDISFVSTLLAKEWLAEKFGNLDFDAAAKPQSAPGLDVDLRTVTGERVVAEIKTTVPYGHTDFGAQQRKSILNDLKKLSTAVAEHKLMFVTDDRAFDFLKRPSYAETAPGISVVHLLSNRSFINGPFDDQNSVPSKQSHKPLLGKSPAVPVEADLAKRILKVVRKSPGFSEKEIAEELFGSAGYQQRVNQDCRLLVGRGLIERRGKGGHGDVFTYSIE